MMIAYDDVRRWRMRIECMMIVTGDRVYDDVRRYRMGIQCMMIEYDDRGYDYRVYDDSI